MDEQPDILSSGPERRPSFRWAGPGRRGWATTLVLTVLLACLGVITGLALLVAQRGHTIRDLRAALRTASHQASALEAGPALPTDSGYAMFTLPGGSFSVVAMAISPRPGSAPVTWLLVYGRHADPGERYGLLEASCGGQFITASDLADGVADQQGDVKIVAPDPDISPHAGNIFVLVYRWQEGAPLGGIQGPLIGNGARIFRSTPPCQESIGSGPGPWPPGETPQPVPG
jgi:hypothetical protein